MGFFKRSTANPQPVPSSPKSPSDVNKNGINHQHAEHTTQTAAATGFKLNKAGEGDEALALFSNVNDVHEDIDPAEEKKLVRKIDFMILPVSVTLNSLFQYLC
jgi:hypothetical protein